MFAFLAPVALFALALSSVSAAPIPKRNVEVRAAPAGWATEYLESYDVYHTRYVALSCQTQHDTTFFDECCHPLLASETLSGNRPAQCTPSTSSAAVETFAPSTTAAAAPAATTSADEEECEVEDESSSAVAVATSTVEAASPATTQEATTTAEVAAAVVAPTTTAAAWNTEAAPTTTTAQAAATTTAASSGSENTGGHATYFLQNGNAGACGNYNSDDTPLVAVPYKWWGTSDSQTSDLCGKYVNIERVSDGAKVTAIIADLCPSCTSDNSLDLSVGAFTSIATEAEGQVDIVWTLA